MKAALRAVSQPEQAVRKASHGALPVTGLVLYTGEPKFENGSAPEGVVPVKAAGAKFVELAAGMPTDALRSRAWALLCAQLLKMDVAAPNRAASSGAPAKVVALRRPAGDRDRSGGGSRSGEIFAFPGPTARS